MLNSLGFTSPAPKMAKKEGSEDAIACEEGPGICALLLTVFSLLLIVASLPLSLVCVVKVVQEYERAVIFRLGRLLTGGPQGEHIRKRSPSEDMPTTGLLSLKGVRRTD